MYIVRSAMNTEREPLGTLLGLEGGALEDPQSVEAENQKLR